MHKERHNNHTPLVAIDKLTGNIVLVSLGEDGLSCGDDCSLLDLWEWDRKAGCPRCK